MKKKRVVIDKVEGGDFWFTVEGENRGGMSSLPDVNLSLKPGDKVLLTADEVPNSLRVEQGNREVAEYVLREIHLISNLASPPKFR